MWGQMSSRTTRHSLWLISVVLACLFFDRTDSGAVVLNSKNVDETLANHEFVFINFYADWCRFSNMLSPIWDEFAEKAETEFGSSGKVVVGKIDCDKEGNLGTRFHITKYPTLKYIRNGQLAKREYRGQRTAEAFLQFVKDQIEDPVREFHSIEELKPADLDGKKRHLIGYFEDKNAPEYEIFRRAATNLKDDCVFHSGYGEAVERMHPKGQSIVAFRPNKATSNEADEVFRGNLLSYDEFSVWASDKCTPMVREITFENAEELTEEGLPFLILFHAPDDTQSIKEFSDVVAHQLMEDKQNVNFLIADGVKFAHPLHHLGKSKADLPLIAIDSFRHMYLFPKYEDMHNVGKLKQFLQDLYSGKLHREFHYGPDKSGEASAGGDSGDQQAGNGNPQIPDNSQNEINTGGNQPHDRVRREQPPPSQFQHLGPSKNRYTLLHDEF